MMTKPWLSSLLWTSSQAVRGKGHLKYMQSIHPSVSSIRADDVTATGMRNGVIVSWLLASASQGHLICNASNPSKRNLWKEKQEGTLFTLPDFIKVILFQPFASNLTFPQGLYPHTLIGQLSCAWPALLRLRSCASTGSSPRCFHVKVW